jgi:Raf kinase inhibitor-like YbhB/YbcL family protein
MLKITSLAFSDGGPIPRAHTCDGADLSPPLTWAGAPEGTKAFALIVDDPDAPGRIWVHWVLYGLDASLSDLPAGIPTQPDLSAPVSAKQGKNDFGRSGYGGPCPPKGRPHRYVFTLFALDARLALPAGSTKDVLLSAIRGHVLEEAKMIGTYGRT